MGNEKLAIITTVLSVVFSRQEGRQITQRNAQSFTCCFQHADIYKHAQYQKHNHIIYKTTANLAYLELESDDNKAFYMFPVPLGHKDL